MAITASLRISIRSLEKLGIYVPPYSIGTSLRRGRLATTPPRAGRTESAFRLEALPEYAVPQEAEMLARFKRGEQVRLPDDYPWLKLVQGATATRKMQRVRVLCSPLTDYLRFELSVYPQCVEAGEEVRITEDQHMARLGDFWIFDRKVIIVLHYDDLGRFIGQTQTDDLAYLDHADLSLTVSTPLEHATRRAG